MTKKNIFIRLKWLWIACGAAVLAVLCFFAGKMIYIKSADTSWQDELGYNENEIYHLKQDRVGCPQIPVQLGGDTYYFDFDTGCNSEIVLTNALEGKFNYTVTDQVEQLNRDGSHRGWSYGINIGELEFFGGIYKNIDCVMIDWKMSSSDEFNGLIGTEMFKNRVVTLDYRAQIMGVGEKAPDYSELPKEKYAVVPILRTGTEGQENLVFFECELNGEKAVVYIDTGKNVSYIHSLNSTYIIGSGTDKRPDTTKRDAKVKIGELSFEIKGAYEAGIAQYDDFEGTIAAEFNSDQFVKNDLVVTFDFIDDLIVFFKR